MFPTERTKHLEHPKLEIYVDKRNYKAKIN